jgi:hypothetical protein
MDQATSASTTAPHSAGTPAAGDTRAAALWIVLGFTFLNSLGSGVVSNGIFFMTDTFFGFSRVQNFLLGIVYGLAYIPAALGIGPLLKRLPAGHRVLNTRSVLATVMLGMGAFCWLPWAGGLATGQTVPPAWTVWVLMVGYSGLSGMLWPMVESYVSGGRSGGPLRGAIGKFNVCWSSSLVVALLVVAPMVETRAVEALQGLGALHILAGLFLLGFPARPAGHAHVEHHHVPPIYRELLTLFRWLLPMAYVVLAALGPYLPIAGASLGLSAATATMVAAIWTAARVGTFILTERWHGWHGHRATPHVGAGLLLTGFACIVLGPAFLPAVLGLPAYVLGLVAFGVGIGVVYAATLYYTMAVGSAEVEAGGLFEALIGSGYVIGPACGLLAAWLVRGGWLPERGLEPVMLGLVATIAGVIMTIAVRRAIRQRAAG